MLVFLYFMTDSNYCRYDLPVTRRLHELEAAVLVLFEVRSPIQDVLLLSPSNCTFCHQLLSPSYPSSALQR